MDAHIQPLGDKAVRIEFDDPFGAPDPATNRRILAFCAALSTSPIRGAIEWVPGFATVAVFYDPLTISYAELIAELARAEVTAVKLAPPKPRIMTIPVVYGGAGGPDLADVAAHCEMSEADVVSLHSSGEYLAYMLGFAPGFPYLGGLSPRLATNRRASPRLEIPAGSVALAGSQTGIYPFGTPGGWNIIGRTSATLYDPQRTPPSLLRAGDVVRFTAVDGEDDS